MRDKDQILLEEALQQVDEGIFDRMKAKSGTRLKSAVGSGINKLGNVMGGSGGAQLSKAAERIGTDVETQRAAKLSQFLSTKMNKIVEQFKKDAQNVGVNLDNLPSESSEPALNGLKAFMGHIEQALEALDPQEKSQDQINQQAEVDAWKASEDARYQQMDGAVN